MARNAESRFQDWVMRELKKIPKLWVFRAFVPTFSGMPDLIGCCNGHFFAWEIKTEKGKASKIQIYVLGKIEKAGGIAEVVRPSTVKEQLAHLRKISGLEGLNSKN